MTKQTKIRSSAAGPASCEAAFDCGALIDANERMLTHAVSVNGHLLDRYAAMGREIVGFFDRRLSADLDGMQALARCHTPAETLTACNAFMQNAAQDYSTQWSRFADLYATIATDTLNETQEDIEDVVDACRPVSFEQS